MQMHFQLLRITKYQSMLAMPLFLVKINKLIIINKSSECMDGEGINDCIACPIEYTLYPVPKGKCRKCEIG